MIWEVWTGFIAELSPSRSFRAPTIFDHQFVVRTSRCVLRKAQIADVPALSMIWADLTVRRFLGGPISAEEAIRRAQSRVDLGELCAVCLLADERIIGCIIVEERCNRVLEIAYLFNVDDWGRGHATEAISALIDEIRRKFGGYEMIAKTQSANLPSRRLLERVGFRVNKEIVEFGELQAIYGQRL